MDFPGHLPLPPVISTLSRFALGIPVDIAASSSPTDVTWPTANLGIFVPFTLPAPYLVHKLFWINGSATAGNVDCGVYSIGGTLLLSAGSTAQSGTSVVQSVTLGSDVLLQPGSYYMALASSSTSAHHVMWAGSVRGLQLCGLAQQATMVPLAATATFATIANARMPICGIARAAVI